MQLTPHPPAGQYHAVAADCPGAREVQPAHGDAGLVDHPFPGIGEDPIRLYPGQTVLVAVLALGLYRSLRAVPVRVPAGHARPTKVQAARPQQLL